jgi:anaerobic ribonucleoside-triphosphate reductase activating protein
LPVEVLAQKLRSEAAQVEGVTFLGGEPFEQAGALAVLAQEARTLGLSVMVFSGFTLEALRAMRNPPVDALLACTDLLVDGPYEAALADRERRWVGSRNQRFHYLSGFYSPAIEKPLQGAAERVLEVRIHPDGEVQINGWPEGWGALQRP